MMIDLLVFWAVLAVGIGIDYLNEAYRLEPIDRWIVFFGMLTVAAVSGWAAARYTNPQHIAVICSIVPLIGRFLTGAIIKYKRAFTVRMACRALPGGVNG